jgi:hypothetical protein
VKKNRHGVPELQEVAVRARREKDEMGFLFYANFVRFVLRGGLAIVLVEQARALIRAAGVGPESGQ